VINLGVNGYGTAQEWLVLQHVGLPYEPDVVVLQIFPENDICNNSLDASVYCGLAFTNEYRPYYVLEAGVPRLTFAHPLRAWLRGRLRSFAYLEKAVMTLRVSWDTGALRPLGVRDYVRELQDEQKLRVREEYGVNFHPNWYTFAEEPEQIESIARGWQVTERLLEEMSRRLGELGIALVAVVVPKEVRVEPEAWEDFARDLEEQGAPRLVRDGPEQRLVRHLALLGHRAVPMLPVFEEHAQEVLPYWDGHLNPAAHALTAEAIYAALVQEDLVRSRVAR
jgi:hypothetical protein